jgi:hypothetical protein
MLASAEASEARAPALMAEGKARIEAFKKEHEHLYGAVERDGVAECGPVYWQAHPQEHGAVSYGMNIDSEGQAQDVDLQQVGRMEYSGTTLPDCLRAFIASQHLAGGPSRRVLIFKFEPAPGGELSSQN